MIQVTWSAYKKLISVGPVWPAIKWITHRHLRLGKHLNRAKHVLLTCFKKQGIPKFIRLRMRWDSLLLKIQWYAICQGSESLRQKIIKKSRSSTNNANQIKVFTSLEDKLILEAQAPFWHMMRHQLITNLTRTVLTFELCTRNFAVKKRLSQPSKITKIAIVKLPIC